MTDTIFALSSGSPPAAIAVLRISGSLAGATMRALAGKLPEPRQAKLALIRDVERGVLLDRALVLWFPGPGSATGEDLGEIHCHGGRAVVSAIEASLEAQAGLRRAESGEFTRRAFENGRIDLAEAEGLADLLAAETELQRQAAMATAGGSLSHAVLSWRERVLGLSALVEAALDFADEEDAVALPAHFGADAMGLLGELQAFLIAPRAERLREGIRVVIAGPTNAGKSSLFNALLSEGAAIVSSEEGTTRDVIERPVAFSSVPFVLVDTAGLRNEGVGPIESIGIEKARAEISRADIILWLGPEGKGPEGSLEIETRADLGGGTKRAPNHLVSSETGEGVVELILDLVVRARELLPRPGTAALNERQRIAIANAAQALESIDQESDLLLLAELLRECRIAFDRLLGRSSTEEMLDALFGRFCIGK